MSNNLEVSPLWTTDDVAAFLNLSTKTIRRWKQTGKIPYVQIGAVVRYRPELIEAWVSDQVRVIEVTQANGIKKTVTRTVNLEATPSRQAG